jgi:nitrous oxidase accessory protein
VIVCLRIVFGASLAVLVLAGVSFAAGARISESAEGGSQSIASLIERAAPGDTVRVPAGTYREQVVIDRPLTLIADGAATIDAGRAGDVVLVTADDVTLRGFVITNSGRDVVAEPAGVRVRGNRAVIEDNRLFDVLYGVVLEDGGGHRVSGNDVSSILEFSPERRGHALYLWHTDHNVIEGNTVTGAKDGIFLGFSSHNRVERNVVTQARYGIHYMYADDNVFLDNVFRGSVAGAAIMFSRGITFRRNEFAFNHSEASGYGLLFKDVDDVEMTDNLVHHNRVGMILEGAPLAPGATVTLSRNLIAFNDTALVLATTTGATFTENAFTGNLEQVAVTGGSVEHHNTWTVEGRGNYWDDYRGYDANGDGVGDIPFRYEGAFDELVRRSEWVRAYAFTPARSTLELATRWFPAFRPDARVVDSSPLLSPPVALTAEPGVANRATALAFAFGLLALPLACWRRMAGTRRAAW